MNSSLTYLDLVIFVIVYASMGLGIKWFQARQIMKARQKRDEDDLG